MSYDTVESEFAADLEIDRQGTKYFLCCSSQQYQTPILNNPNNAVIVEASSYEGEHASH